jgi:hypothetical protein
MPVNMHSRAPTRQAAGGILPPDDRPARLGTS